MNIEDKIRNNREAFDDVKMPEGSRERFEALLCRDGQRPSEVDTQGVTPQKIRKIRFMMWTSVAAAAITLIMIMTNLDFGVKPISTESPQVADNKVVELRRFYDSKMDEAIANLESLMQKVDDSTRMQINTVIHDLMDMGDVFAEMAPLPEDRQMALTEQIYDNNLRTLELLTDKINK